MHQIGPVREDLVDLHGTAVLPLEVGSTPSTPWEGEEGPPHPPGSGVDNEGGGVKGGGGGTWGKLLGGGISIRMQQASPLPIPPYPPTTLPHSLHPPHQTGFYIFIQGGGGTEEFFYTGWQCFTSPCSHETMFLDRENSVVWAVQFFL